MKRFKTLCFSLLMTSMASFGQEIVTEELPTATLDDNFTLTLDASSPIAPHYYVDISEMSFDSAEDAQKKAQHYLTANLISTEVFYEEEYMVIHIHTEYLPEDATLEQLQGYINHLTKP